MKAPKHGGQAGISAQIVGRHDGQWLAGELILSLKDRERLEPSLWIAQLIVVARYLHNGLGPAKFLYPFRLATTDVWQKDQQTQLHHFAFETKIAHLFESHPPKTDYLVNVRCFRYTSATISVVV